MRHLRQPHHLSGRVKPLDGLSVKQALATLLVALAVGLTSSAFELVMDIKAERIQVRHTMQQQLQMARGSAAEAAFQLNNDLADMVVVGLLGYDAVVSVVLRDNFGSVLGQQQRPVIADANPRLARALFGDIVTYSLSLKAVDSAGNIQEVGMLDVGLDAGLLTERFTERSLRNVYLGLIRALGLSLVVVAIFYLMITKPLLRLAHSISQIDAAHPAAHLVRLDPRHAKDELGLVAQTVNALLTAFQVGLDRRAEADANLVDLNRTLEQRVAERTEHLNSALNDVAREKQLVDDAHAELTKASTYISESIRYASRIQGSLLPQRGAETSFIHEMAVVWQPRDVVGGDFYWVGRFEERYVVAIIDCTGHGVPGAFMTAIVASLLDRVLHEYCNDNPAHVLAILNRLVKRALRQEGPDSPSDDGLDAAICIVDTKRGQLSYAGAQIPLVMLRDGQIDTVRADRHSLGYRDSEADFSFTRHDLPLTAGTTFYLFTDGMVDQVGGTQRRLFGRKRLEAMLLVNRDQPLQAQANALLAALATYRGAEAPRDDMTFVAFTPLAPGGDVGEA